MYPRDPYIILVTCNHLISNVNKNDVANGYQDGIGSFRLMLNPLIPSNSYVKCILMGLYGACVEKIYERKKYRRYSIKIHSDSHLYNLSNIHLWLKHRVKFYLQFNPRSFISSSNPSNKKLSNCLFHCYASFHKLIRSRQNSFGNFGFIISSNGTNLLEDYRWDSGYIKTFPRKKNLFFNV